MNRIALIALLAVASGCTMKHNAVPEAAPEFAKADYKVLGQTNHEECGSYIFGIDFGHLFSNQRATRISSSALPAIPFIGGMSPEESRALYHALDKMPEATHLLAHRTNTVSTGLTAFGTPIFGKRCASIQARGVVIGDKPLPGVNTL